jgi:ribosomal-protein-alanine N-acetyltransferase
MVSDLKSSRLILRELTWEDLLFIHHLHSQPEVDEYNTLGIPRDIEDTKKVMEPIIGNREARIRKIYGWVIIERKSHRNLGMAGMSVTADRFNMGEIYYKFLPIFWGKGYATETSRTLIEFGFEKLKLHRIEAGVATDNKRSIRVLEKSGMTCEGIRRKILPIRGEWKDNYHYAIVEDDYWTLKR